MAECKGGCPSVEIGPALSTFECGALVEALRTAALFYRTDPVALKHIMSSRVWEPLQGNPGRVAQSVENLADLIAESEGVLLDISLKVAPKPREIRPGDCVRWSGIGLIGPPSGETATVLSINRDTRCAVVSLDRLRANCLVSERYYSLGSIELVPEATA